MSIFTMDNTLWGVVPGNSTAETRMAIFNETELAKYFSLSCGTWGGTYDDTIYPLNENFSGLSLKNSGGDKWTYVFPGTSNLSKTGGRFYTATAYEAVIFGFGSADRIYGYYAFIDGKVADITETDETLLIARFIIDNTDKAYLYCSKNNAVMDISSGFATRQSVGYCEKFMLSPLAFKGIRTDMAFTVDGGMSDISEGVCKIDSSYFFKMAKDIVVKIDNLVK